MATPNPHGKSIFLENSVWFGCVAWNADSKTLTAKSSVMLDRQASSTHIAISNQTIDIADGADAGFRRFGIVAEDISPGTSGIVYVIGMVKDVNCGRVDANGNRATITGTWIDASTTDNNFDGTFRSRRIETSTSMIGVGFIMEGLATSTDSISDVFLTMRRI